MAENIKELYDDVITEDSKWISAVTALLKLTQTGALKWERTSQSEAFPGVEPESEIEFVYTAKLKDLGFRLYETVSAAFRSSSLLNAWSDMLGNRDSLARRRSATRRIILEAVDDNLKSLFTFPQVSALADLLSAVKYQVSDVENVLDSILKEANSTPIK
jgi:hypothetical protein